MKRKSERSLAPLFKLYCGYYFQKSSIIVIAVSFILMFSILFLFTYIDYDMESYIINFEDIHIWFLSKSFLIVGIFNLIIISSISIITNITSNDFDKLFLSKTKRSKILLSKMLVCIILICIVTLLEFTSIIAIAYLRYPLFKIGYSDLKALLYIFIETLFNLVLSFTLTELITSLFTPFLVLFISIIFKILINDIKNLNDILRSYLPILEIDKNLYFNMSGLYISLLWIGLLIIIYFIIYHLKDIK